MALGKGIIAGVTMLGNAILWLGRAFWLLSRAVLTNPIVLAIAAIVAAGWWLYNNWDNVTGFVRDRWQALTEWWNNTPIGQKIIDIFNAPLRFIASLGEILWGMLVAAGNRIVEAITNWPVMQSIMDTFGPAIQWAVDKIDWLMGKVKTAWDAVSGLIYQDTQLNRVEAPAYFKKLQENTPASVAQPAPAPTLNKPQASATQNINIHINADGMGNKEAAALIGAEVKKEMAMLDRKQKAAARSAFYDAHA